MVVGLSSYRTTHSPYVTKRELKIVADALSCRVFILTKMSTAVNGFERLKTEYESCPDFHEIYVELKDGTTREVDGFVLHDGYLFIGRKLCILRTSLREFLV